MALKEKIIEDLFNDAAINECINKANYRHLHDDLKGELMLILLEKPDSRIVELHGKNQLVFYSINIILKMIKGDRHPFTSKYLPSRYSAGLHRLRSKSAIGWLGEGRTTEAYSLFIPIGNVENVLIDEPYSEENCKGLDALELILINIKQIADDKIPKYIRELDEMYVKTGGKEGLSWYEQHMLSYYMKYGSYRAMQKGLNDRGVKMDYRTCRYHISKAVKKLKTTGA